MRPRPRPLGAAAGLAADALAGEPPVEPHPLVVFGRAMTSVESRLYANSRGRGVLQALAGVATGVADPYLDDERTVAALPLRADESAAVDAAAKVASRAWPRSSSR